MPSLPELEVYRRHFTPQLLNQPVKQVQAHDYRVVRVDIEQLNGQLAGRSFTGLRRYGKWLIWEFGRPEQLIMHLGLTGRLKLLEDPEAKLPRQSAYEIDFDDQRRLVMTDPRKLGRLYLRNFAELKTEKALGPDYPSVPESFFTTDLRRKRRGARDVLMDQKVIAGIGGKYADEFLWQARLHPNTKLDSLPESKLAELYHIMQDVTQRAIDLDADVDRFPDDWLIPHRRGDKICPRCGHALASRKMGGEAFYCPNDQPAPMPFRSG